MEFQAARESLEQLRRYDRSGRAQCCENVIFMSTLTINLPFESIHIRWQQLGIELFKLNISFSDMVNTDV